MGPWTVKNLAARWTEETRMTVKKENSRVTTKKEDTIVTTNAVVIRVMGKKTVIPATAKREVIRVTRNEVDSPVMSGILGTKMEDDVRRMVIGTVSTGRRMVSKSFNNIILIIIIIFNCRPINSIWQLKLKNNNDENIIAVRFWGDSLTVRN